VVFATLENENPKKEMIEELRKNESMEFINIGNKEQDGLMSKLKE
jgi:soluble P-type ATPase